MYAAKFEEEQSAGWRKQEELLMGVNVKEIASEEEAFLVAKQFEAREERRLQLVKKLKEEDLVGLECRETVELEKLADQDGIYGLLLAKWIIRRWAEKSL